MWIYTKKIVHFSPRILESLKPHESQVHGKCSSDNAIAVFPLRAWMEDKDEELEQAGDCVWWSCLSRISWNLAIPRAPFAGIVPVPAPTRTLVQISIDRYLDAAWELRYELWLYRFGGHATANRDREGPRIADAPSTPRTGKSMPGALNSEPFSIRYMHTGMYTIHTPAPLAQ